MTDDASRPSRRSRRDRARAALRRFIRIPDAEVLTTAVMTLLAAVFVKTGVARLPAPPPPTFQHPPVLVYSEPMLKGAIVRATRTLMPHTPLLGLKRWSNLTDRAPGNRGIAVTVTRYCLNGMTRRDHWVREGIVAADPRVFPLARYVELFVGHHYLGRFLVDDTGGNVKGATLDVWTPSCSEARRFGRQQGTAMLVMKPER